MHWETLLHSTPPSSLILLLLGSWKVKGPQSPSSLCLIHFRSPCWPLQPPCFWPDLDIWFLPPGKQNRQPWKWQAPSTWLETVLGSTGRRTGPQSWLHCPWQPHVAAGRVNTAVLRMWLPEAHKEIYIVLRSNQPFSRQHESLLMCGQLKEARKPSSEVIKARASAWHPKKEHSILPAYHLSPVLKSLSPMIAMNFKLRCDFLKIFVLSIQSNNSTNVYWVFIIFKVV